MRLSLTLRRSIAAVSLPLMLGGLASVKRTAMS